MIVGADLNADDVAAILAGDESRMAARLNRELEDRGAWPEDVQHGAAGMDCFIRLPGGPGGVPGSRANQPAAAL